MLTTLLFVMHWIIVALVAVKVVFRRLPVGTSLGWIIIVSALPVIGFGLYMLIGDHRLGRKRLRHGDLVRRYYQKRLDIKDGAVSMQHPEVETAFFKIARVAAKETGFVIRPDNAVTIFDEAEEMFESLISDIDQCRDVCHLEFYIVHPEGRVLEVFRALIDAAGRGVECKLIADHIGSKAFLNGQWPKRLEEAGITVIDSLPTGIIKTFFTRSDLRNHRKIVVLDRWIGYTGSFNLADPDYFKSGAGVGKWVDVFVRIEGNASEALAVVFNTDYVIETAQGRSVTKIPPLSALEAVPETDESHQSLVQIIPSGPEMRTSVIYETIISSIYAAKDFIRITTPYFVPGESLMLALTNAARRGVKVQIILPKRVDSFLARYAGRSYYGELLKAGVSLHEFQDDLLHSKIILIDDDVCYLGTVNLDMRSFYLNLEITLALHSRDDCLAVGEILNRYVAGSTVIMKDEYMDENRSPRSVFFENLIRLTGPLL